MFKTFKFTHSEHNSSGMALILMTLVYLTPCTEFSGNFLSLVVTKGEMGQVTTHHEQIWSQFRDVVEIQLQIIPGIRIDPVLFDDLQRLNVYTLYMYRVTDTSALTPRTSRSVLRII